MRNFDRGSKTREWARLAVKLGLLLTEPKVLQEMGNRLNDRADSVADAITRKADAITRKYEDTVNRLEAASDALRGRSRWPSHAIAALAGIAIGAGFGILLAPASGEEIRREVRDRAMGIKNSVKESASSAASHVRSSFAAMSSTGSEG
jgi:gas vesicle protein